MTWFIWVGLLLGRAVETGDGVKAVGKGMIDVGNHVLRGGCVESENLR